METLESLARVAAAQVAAQAERQAALAEGEVDQQRLKGILAKIERTVNAAAVTKIA